MGEYGLLVLLLRIAHGAGHLYIYARIYMHFTHLYVNKYMYKCTRPHTRMSGAHTLAHKHTHAQGTDPIVALGASGETAMNTPFSRLAVRGVP